MHSRPDKAANVPTLQHAKICLRILRGSRPGLRSCRPAGSRELYLDFLTASGGLYLFHRKGLGLDARFRPHVLPRFRSSGRSAAPMRTRPSCRTATPCYDGITGFVSCGHSPRPGRTPIRAVFRSGIGQSKPSESRNCIMAKVCVVTGKKPMSGNNVSHANNKTRRRFEPNLQDKRFWVPSEKRWVKLRVSAKAIKIISKKGIERVLADLRNEGLKV